MNSLNAMRAFRALMLFGLIAAILEGQNGNAKADSLRVSITVHGLRVSHSQVKPGNVQVILDNQTALRNPSLVIRKVLNSGLAESRASQEVDQGGRGESSTKKSGSVTLGAGIYEISLAHFPTATVRVTVGQ